MNEVRYKDSDDPGMDYSGELRYPQPEDQNRPDQKVKWNGIEVRTSATYTESTGNYQDEDGVDRSMTLRNGEVSRGKVSIQWNNVDWSDSLTDEKKRAWLSRFLVIVQKVEGNKVTTEKAKTLLDLVDETTLEFKAEATIELDPGAPVDGVRKENNLVLLPVEVVELSPKTKDEDGNEIAGSEKPNSGKPLTPFVEVDSNANKIAHREIKVKIGDGLKDKKVTWTLEALPGATPATIRGEWDHSPTHKDRFEASTAYGANAFRKVSQSSGETTVGADGHTAIRVNVPPIGFNQVRIKIQIEGMSTPIDLIDMEVPGVVVIDPGHGGTDSGAVGRTDDTVKEKDMTLTYGLRLREELVRKFAAEERGLQVKMTRFADNFVELGDRAPYAKDYGADVFVSIHFNSSAPRDDGTYPRGTETFAQSEPGNVNLAEDRALAGAVNATTLAAVTASDAGAVDRGVKTANFAVVKDGENSNGNATDRYLVKACLVEVEFLSNETAMGSVRLPGGTGTAIMDAFSMGGANDIFSNILNQP